MRLGQRPTTLSNTRLSISQHYHHSAHQLAPEGTTTPTQGGISDSEAIEILARHGIEAIHLSFSQAALFKKADDSQRNRLIELWRISPPQPSDWQASGGPREISLDMEESLARQRYESNSRGRDMDVGTGAEPYIKTGYESISGATYSPLGSAVGGLKAPTGQMHGAEWWRDFMGNQPMELQYGMLNYMNYQPPTAALIGGDDSEMH
ncbi:MAG: hypothetical protein GOMPHAMPRED_002786 [Gomphillus americanus]|uniref:Uncharacterized protein n=1 Tax=Gomphillus americanus TaxID=1940652 RepID=A0A8H3IRF0_9LECA|nr:MAG: hypothetical protein GOMPHAMPRED_002786 [Gomphillus americanus]